MSPTNQSVIESTSSNINKLSNRPNAKQEAFLLVCQITGFNEAKINKIVSGQSDMIMNFDFYVNNGRDSNLKKFNKIKKLSTF